MSCRFDKLKRFVVEHLEINDDYFVSRIHIKGNHFLFCSSNRLMSFFDISDSFGIDFRVYTADKFSAQIDV